jgi:hypothetical protein
VIVKFQKSDFQQEDLINLGQTKHLGGDGEKSAN